MTVATIRPSGIPLGPLANRKVLVHLEDGGSWWKVHSSSACSGLVEDTVPEEHLFLDAATSRDLCQVCLPSPELLLDLEERPYFWAAEGLAGTTLGLRSALRSPSSTWVMAAQFLSYVSQFEKVNVSGHPELLEFQADLSRHARTTLDVTLSRLRRRGDRPLLALFAAVSLRDARTPGWDGHLSALEAQTSALVRLSSFPILRLLRRSRLQQLSRRLAESTGTVSVCGPLPATPGDLRVLFRVALLRWASAPTDPAVLEVPAVVADVLSPIAPRLCVGRVPPEVAETFLVLWDGSSDPRPALEASGAILS